MGATIRYVPDLGVRNLGPLPVLMPFLQRLGLQELVDTLVPTTRHAHLTHGQVVCALVLNRLLSPRALYAVGEWTRHAAIPDALHLPEGQLNDDRLLRTLDAIFPHLEALQGSLTWKVLEAFELDASVVHWDMTSFFFEGTYEPDDQDPEAALVNYGFPKKQDAGKWRKQMQVGLAVAEDGGVPFWHRPFSGNAAEVAQVADVMERLKELVRPSRFTLVGDSKLITPDNLLKALRLGLDFLGPEPRSEAIAARYLALRTRRRLQRIAYAPATPARQGQPAVYMGFEEPFALRDPDTGQVHRLRRLFIVSSEERRATRRNRRRKLAKLDAEVAEIRRQLGRRRLKTADQVRVRLETLLQRDGLSQAFIWSVEGEGPTLRLSFAKDPKAFRRLRQLDGVYTLVTSLGPEHALDGLLARYKRQFLSERRFGDLKGPLHLRPLFLKKNRRIVALVFILYVALLVYCLIERTARRTLQAAGASLRDPYTGRPQAAPTARRLLLPFERRFRQVEKTAGGPMGLETRHLLG